MTLTIVHLLADPEFQRLKSFVIAMTGLAYFQHKDDDLANRLLKRFIQLGITDCGSYLVRLGAGTAAGSELDLLINDLTIGETYFFRHAEQFDAFRTVIVPELIRKNAASKRISIWCAGCSTGAEPYTLSILLRKEFRLQLVGWTIEILGTDINRGFLSRAREGLFDDWHLRSTDSEMRNACFEKHEKSWCLKSEFKEGVSFHFHNLINGQYPPRYEGAQEFDAIFCRNVMIYFSHDTIRSILPQFNRCLTTSGWLLLGYSEINTDLYKAFDLVPYPGAIIFQKRGGDAFRTRTLINPFESIIQASVPPLLDSALYLVNTLPQPMPAPYSLALAAGLPFSDSLTPSIQLDPLLPSHSSLAATVPSGSVRASNFKPAADIHAPPLPQDAKKEEGYSQCRNYLHRGDFKAALVSANAILAKGQLDARAHYLKALALLRLGHDQDAEDVLRKAIYLDRKLTLAHYQLALLYKKIRQDEKARRYFANVYELLIDMEQSSELAEGEGMTAGQLADNLRSKGGAA